MDEGDSWQGAGQTALATGRRTGQREPTGVGVCVGVQPSRHLAVELERQGIRVQRAVDGLCAVSGQVHEDGDLGGKGTKSRR